MSSDWGSLLHRSVLALREDYDGNLAQANLVAGLKLFTPIVATAVVKSVANSWCTSFRFHEPLYIHAFSAVPHVTRSPGLLCSR